MRHHALVKLGTPVLVGAMVLTACGSREEGSPSGDTGKKTVMKIGVIAPLSGELSALGLGIKNSADLAARKATEMNEVPGVEFQVMAEDDQAKPAVAQQAATKVSADPAVVGVVGTLNSSTSQTVQPVLSTKKLLQVSPANTNPTLTQGADWKNNKKRAYETYFRTATTDAIQGPFAARYVWEDLKLKKVATVHDKKTYGQGLVETFTEEYKKLGGQVVAAETIDPEDKDFSAVISSVKGKKPQLVYYGGEYPQSAPLSEQMKSKGLAVPLMGGDGMYSADFIKLTKGKGVGDFATSVGAPTEKLASAQQFVENYKKAGFKEAYEAYGAYSYDAAWTIIQAVKKAGVTGKATLSAEDREKVTKAAQEVEFEGVTGKVSFDEFGDTETKILTVYKVEGNDWKPAKTDEFE